MWGRSMFPSGQACCSGGLWSLLAWAVVTSGVYGQFLADKSHVTTKAAVQQQDIWCYTCESMEATGSCVDLIGNHSSMYSKCPSDRRICMVRRYSYLTSTENSTSEQRMWALERNCTAHCDSGCIVIGERTKLFSCVACCETSLCNTGNGHDQAASPSPLLAIGQLVLLGVVASSLEAP